MLGLVQVLFVPLGLELQAAKCVAGDTLVAGPTKT